MLGGKCLGSGSKLRAIKHVQLEWIQTAELSLDDPLYQLTHSHSHHSAIYASQRIVKLLVFDLPPPRPLN